MPVYLWEGKTNVDNEAMMIIKTSEDKVSEVTKEIKKIHSYDLPEIISISVPDGSNEYINWIKSITGGSQI